MYKPLAVSRRKVMKNAFTAILVCSAFLFTGAESVATAQKDIEKFAELARAYMMPKGACEKFGGRTLALSEAGYAAEVMTKGQWNLRLGNLIVYGTKTYVNFNEDQRGKLEQALGTERYIQTFCEFQ